VDKVAPAGEVCRSSLVDRVTRSFRILSAGEPV